MIKITNASKKIGQNYVLKDINLTLASGKVYGFIGENGSGKTMLFRAICGLITLTQGQIQIGDLLLDGNKVYKDIGLLLENPSFIGDLSGFDNLAMISSIRNIIDKDRIIEVLQKVGLEKSMKKLYKEYSLGMKQRLGIANAIMENPKVLIFDEPTIALDKDGVACLIKIIKEEKDNGKTILISSHEREIIEDLCDEVYFMKDGIITNNQ